MNRRRQARLLKEWEDNGRLGPPPHLFKAKVLKEYAKDYNLKVFVETGTFQGDMVESMKRSFNKIFSIELSQQLFAEARERFKTEKHIEIIQGNSGRELGKVLSRIRERALFWLDGHYSAGVTARGEKDTPVLDELAWVLNSQELGHVIVIDDARCFGTDPSYPTIQELKEFIRSKRENVEIAVQDDIVRIVPEL